MKLFRLTQAEDRYIRRNYYNAKDIIACIENSFLSQLFGLGNYIIANGSVKFYENSLMLHEIIENVIDRELDKED